MEIPLKNKNGKIIAHAIISKEDYEHLSQFNLFKDNDNYVKFHTKDKLWRLHRYIMIEILGNEITPQQPVDHINGNPLDNRRENLRVSTLSENARNKQKKENTTSKYMGISFKKNENKCQSARRCY
jgi:hypothetical protein